MDALSSARKLTRLVSVATAGSPNESNLRHEVENALESICVGMGIPWTPFQLDLTLDTKNKKVKRYADVAHGAVVIEYEPPKSFRGRKGAVVAHAIEQVEEYTDLISREEGRAIQDYVMVIWDGENICFGKKTPDGMSAWESLRTFDDAAAERLINCLRDDGSPLVHPLLISTLVGPETEYGNTLIPKFFDSIQASITLHAETTKTKLLFTEWQRLFGQVVGIQTDRLKDFLEKQGQVHGRNYWENPSAYLFSLNTYIALVAKLVAAFSLPSASENLLDSNASISNKVHSLESGTLFSNAGISNMLNGDFFSWYQDDRRAATFLGTVEKIVDRFRGVNFDVTKKAPESTRDLFKGMYESFVPGPLRHALGEFYTPDWLAAHAFDVVNWKTDNDLLDPTCGTGTFILEALRRRLIDSRWAGKNADELLENLFGLDLNPLAVLAARASLVVFLANKFDPEKPVRLPIFLSDSINPAMKSGHSFNHKLQTQLGIKEFLVPASLVTSKHFFEVFGRLRELVDGNISSEKIGATLKNEFDFEYFIETDTEDFRNTIETLIEIHKLGWNGIWCSILADRFAAGAIEPREFILGNPPWVKWSHLPPEYAEFIKPRCLELGVFSEDRWVGGIESDISTVITYEAIEKWLADKGTLAFFITGTVFTTPSSQGFRKFKLETSGIQLNVELVEDFSQISPFEDVSNQAALLVLKKSEPLKYPVSYRKWIHKIGAKKKSEISNETEFEKSCSFVDLLASPVPGQVAGPWLKGTKADHVIWKKIFGAQDPEYQARKGITTDLNGVYFVRAIDQSNDLCKISNEPGLGRKDTLGRVSVVVEKEHLFPLLRGRGVAAFVATVDPEYKVILPQRGMHGDPDLAINAKKTYAYFERFKDSLKARSSYKRFQAKQPYWSVWSTGDYTFSPFKVLWKEMSGGRFAAAYIGTVDDAILGNKVAIPDHKLYFVPCSNENEAAFLTAILNAPTMSRAISAYASELSLGVSVVEYLKIPKYTSADNNHKELAKTAKKITKQGDGPTESELAAIDVLTKGIFHV